MSQVMQDPYLADKINLNYIKMGIVYLNLNRFQRILQFFKLI